MTYRAVLDFHCFFSPSLEDTFRFAMLIVAYRTYIYFTFIEKRFKNNNCIPLLVSKKKYNRVTVFVIHKQK